MFLSKRIVSLGHYPSLQAESEAKCAATEQVDWDVKCSGCDGCEQWESYV